MQVFCQGLNVPCLVAKVLFSFVKLVGQEPEFVAFWHLRLVAVLGLFFEKVDFLSELADRVIFLEKLAFEELDRVFFVYLRRHSIC